MGERVKFTKRQLEIAELAITGMSNKEIAAHLNISYRTVELQLTTIYREAEIVGGQGSKRIRLMNKIREER
jgi:DNA-binding NarL/FixJ family response regulator